MDVIWIELTIIAILMGFSALFSSSETALFSLSSAQLEQMRRDGHPRLELIERLLSQPRRLIITILIGNELVNVAASVISASIIIRLLGAEGKWMNLIIMIPVLLLLGEITPKTLAIRNNVAFASFESRPIEFFARITRPVRWVVRSVAGGLITLIVGKERSRGNIITEDMVRVLAREAVGEGVLDRFEAEFIEQIFDFGDKRLEDVMTPRSQVFFVSLDWPFPRILEELISERHTKVPVFREHEDNVIGILHTRDLIGADLDELPRGEDALEGALREAYFVPQTKLASSLFHTFRDRKLSIALCVDEYGGVTGLVTMEDLLECIFGDIHSPSDERPKFEKLGDGSYTVDGTVPIDVVNRKIGSSLSEEHAETVGGWILHKHGELPPKGTVVSEGAVRFTVTEVTGNRVDKVLLHPENVDPKATERSPQPSAGTTEE